MGGQYPSGGEFNFAGVDTGSAHHVVDGWLSDVPITFAGLELGRDMPSAARLGTDAARRDSPVRAAYEWHVDRCSTPMSHGIRSLFCTALLALVPPRPGSREIARLQK